jgi:hypothetical protein
MRLTPTALAAGFALVLPALPVSAATLTVTGVAHTGGVVQFDVPTVEVEDGNLDEATIRAIFNGDVKVGAPALSDLDAKAIRIPTITMKTSQPGAPATVYHDVEILDVVDGIAGSAVLGGTDVTGDNDVKVTLGKIAVSNLDIGALLSFYGLGGDTPPADPVTIYSNIHFDGGTVSADKVNCTIGAADVAEFKARPPKGGPTALIELSARMQQEQKLGGRTDPKTVAAFIAAYVDYLTSFEMSPMSFDGVTCDGVSDKDKPLKIAVGALSLGGWTNSIFSPITLGSIDVTVENEGHVAFESATLKQIDFSPTIKALAAAGDSVDAAWFEANWASLVPIVDGLSVTGLDIDVPGERGGPRTTVSLGSLDLSLADYANGMPGRTSLAVSGLVVPLPSDATEFAATLKDAGFEKVTLGFGMTVDWNADARTATISNLNLDAADLGAVTVDATLGNITPGLFSPDKRVQEQAQRLVTIKELHVQLNNAGLLPMLIAQGAAEAGQPPEAFQSMVLGVTAGTTMALLGASPQTLATVQAFSEFLAGRPGLDVTMTSVDPNGIGVADFEALQKDPRVLAGKMQVTATATGDAPAAQ